MIVLIDYGVGNLYSVAKAVASVGGDVKISSSADDIKRAEKIILPGVGAFGDCMKNLEATGLIPTIKQEIFDGKKILGICVGLQIMFAGSEESPFIEGLKFFGGNVKKIRAGDLKIPHMGWNSVKFGGSKLFAGLSGEPYFYFVHSYHASPDDTAKRLQQLLSLKIFSRRNFTPKNLAMSACKSLKISSSCKNPIYRIFIRIYFVPR